MNFSADRFADPAAPSLPIVTVTPEDFSTWLAAAEPRHRNWLGSLGFEAKPGKHALLPGPEGALEKVVFVAKEGARWAFAGLVGALPPGNYRVEGLGQEAHATTAALAWALGGYRFDRYRSEDSAKPDRLPRLHWPDLADRAYVAAAAEATALVRDLINTPANDMGPAELTEAARSLAGRFGAGVTVTEGHALETGFPLIHAVGVGSPRTPRLIDWWWGDPAHPQVTLVGKGVCFDTGGLDIKPDSNMLTMKKDMGGAAHAMGLALMIMAMNLPLRLRVLIPAVENSVSGRAMRPLDVIRSRKGLTVEIGNTDAEGRLVLADALTEASTANPALVLDFATLTGAARVALGPDIPPFFCNDEATAKGLLAASKQSRDPLWRLPLHQPYAEDLKGKVADLNNIAAGGFAGAIYAALFMEKFVAEGVTWAHFDVYGWNQKSRPGRPEGGEAFAMLACFAYLRELAAK